MTEPRRRFVVSVAGVSMLLGWGAYLRANETDGECRNCNHYFLRQGNFVDNCYGGPKHLGKDFHQYCIYNGIDRCLNKPNGSPCKDCLCCNAGWAGFFACVKVYNGQCEPRYECQELCCPDNGITPIVDSLCIFASDERVLTCSEP